MARGAAAAGPGLSGTPFEAVVRVVDVDVLVVGLAVLVTLVEVEVSSVVAVEAGGG